MKKIVKYSLTGVFTLFVLLPVLLLMLVNFYSFRQKSSFDENSMYKVKDEFTEYYKWTEPKESDEVYERIVNYYNDMIDEEEIIAEIASSVTNPLKAKEILTDTFGDNIPTIIKEQ